MEHIVQFGISIDDELIKAQVAKNAEKTIIENLQRDVEKIIFGIDGWGKRVVKGVPSEWLERRVNAFLESHKEEIILAASNLLASRLAKSKAGKAILEGIAKEERGSHDDY